VTPAVIVIAKAPEPGRVKTRLCPPLTFGEAAAVATAALRDTLRAATVAAPGRVVLALDGDAGEWLAPFAVDVIAQRGDVLAARLANAFADVGGPAVLVGMDTPQLQPSHLEGALDALERHDAVLGACDDGGFWIVGARHPHPKLFRGIPMSRDDTGARQLARLRAHGLDVATLPRLRDVDGIADAEHVAAIAPHTEFAAAVRALAVAAVPS
jgi:rSAM/selenodomain-associated transferase 1